MFTNSNTDKEGTNMKKPILSLGILSLLTWCTIAHAFVSGSTGALGPFSPTANTVVTLPTNGVLNYTTINIPAGVTVTFNKNVANTPVYMLASGDVNIAGTIDVSEVTAEEAELSEEMVWGQAAEAQVQLQILLLAVEDLAQMETVGLFKILDPGV